MNQRLTFVSILDRLLKAGIFILVFLAPLKWGLPFLDFDQSSLPMNLLEWWVNPWPVEIFVLIVFSLGILACVRCILTDGLKGLWDLWTFSWIGFVLAAWMATALSLSFRISQHYALLWTAFLIFFVLVRRYLSRKSFLMAILSAGLMIALDAMIQKVTGLESTLAWARIYYANDPLFNEIVQKLSSERVFGTFVYPNTLAGYLLMIIPLGAWFLNSLIRKQERDVAKTWFSIFLLSMTGTFFWVSLQTGDDTMGLAMVLVLNLINACLLPFAFLISLGLTRSFGGGFVLGIVLLVAILFIRFKRRWLPYLILTGFLAVVSLGLIYFSNYPEFWNKWNSYLSRWDYWKAAFQMFFAKPFTGWGPGLFGSIYPQFMVWGAEETQMVHNNYFQVLAETGLFGFLFFCFFWGGILFIGLRNWTREDAFHRVLALGLLGFVLHGLIDFDYYVPGNAIVAFSFAGFLASQPRQDFEKKQNGSPAYQKAVFAFLIFFFAWALLWEGQRIDAQWNFHLSLKSLKNNLSIEAEKYLKRSIALDPLNPGFYYRLGTFYEEQKNISSAWPCFQQAVQLNPVNPFYHVSLARAYYQKGKAFYPRVRQELEKAVECYPSNQSYRLALADFLEKQGDLSGALEQYQKILKFQPRIAFIQERVRKLKERLDLEEAANLKG